MQFSTKKSATTHLSIVADYTQELSTNILPTIQQFLYGHRRAVVERT